MYLWNVSNLEHFSANCIWQISQKVYLFFINQFKLCYVWRLLIVNEDKNINCLCCFYSVCTYNTDKLHMAYHKMIWRKKDLKKEKKMMTTWTMAECRMIWFMTKCVDMSDEFSSTVTQHWHYSSSSLIFCTQSADLEQFTQTLN